METSNPPLPNFCLTTSLFYYMSFEGLNSSFLLIYAFLRQWGSLSPEQEALVATGGPVWPQRVYPVERLPSGKLVISLRYING